MHELELSNLLNRVCVMTKHLGLASLIEEEIRRLELEEAAISGSSPEYKDPRLQRLRQDLEHELAMKRVVIIGTSHDAQQNGDPKNQGLESRISYLVERLAPGVLVEEWAEGRGLSFLNLLSAQLHLNYENVGTPVEERFKTFVGPLNYPGHDGTLGCCCDAPPMDEYGPIANQENRELQMTENIQRKMKNYQVGLFVVGLAHLHSMSRKLSDAGFNVTSYSWLPSSGN